MIELVSKAHYPDSATGDRVYAQSLYPANVNGHDLNGI